MIYTCYFINIIHWLHFTTDQLSLFVCVFLVLSATVKHFTPLVLKNMLHLLEGNRAILHRLRAVPIAAPLIGREDVPIVDLVPVDVQDRVGVAGLGPMIDGLGVQGLERGRSQEVMIVKGHVIEN